MRAACRWMIILAILLSTLGFFPAQGASAAPAPSFIEGSPLLQSQSLALVGPSSCPPGGCAAGQRLSMRFGFDPSGLDGAQTPNVKVCVFVPTSWTVDAASVTVASTGEVTNLPYAEDATPTVCDLSTPAPDNYSLLFERDATLDSGAFSDAVNFSFRLGGSATGNGPVLARLSTNNAGTWSAVRSATSPTLNLTAAALVSYVANDVSTCGSYSPCYVNSADDLPNGLGTGLKDAVDVALDNGTVMVLGSYTIKSNTVVIERSQPITVTGVGDATITYNGPGACTLGVSMLSLRGPITLRGLNIDDGICGSTSRHLIEVDSTQAVEISSNDLYNGDNAIVVRDNTGAVTIRFNDISGNAGKAVFFDNHTNGAAAELVANNLSGNGSGAPVDCSGAATAPVANRRANHNYWGGSTPSNDQTHCTMTAGKRLGMAIVHKSGAPGVDAQLVTVADEKTSSFNNQIAYERTNGADFGLYIVNHGYATAGGPPFTQAAGGESPSPCSNYWDIFLPAGENVSGATLELYFKYDKTAGCIAAINSSLYCDQTTTPGKYPLFWYDPATNATKWWDHTAVKPENLSSGEGQTTSCNMNSNEIQVSIDGAGRPDLTTDLAYAPFMVGVPVIKTFLPLASSKQVTITWTTNNEPDVQGFYILRSTDGSSFAPITDLIPHTGTALVGKSYSYADTGRTNGVRYYYRLQVVRTDGASIYSEIKDIIANVATITPTLTKIPTFTRTIQYVTPTRTFTRAVSQFPTRQVTPSPTQRGRTPSATSLLLPTLTSTFGTEMAEGTGVAGGSGSGLDETEMPLEENITDRGTPIAMIDGTPVPSEIASIEGTATGTGTKRANPWLSLLLGILTGTASVGALASLWYFLLKR